MCYHDNEGSVMLLVSGVAWRRRYDGVTCCCRLWCYNGGGFIHVLLFEILELYELY